MSLYYVITNYFKWFALTPTMNQEETWDGLAVPWEEYRIDPIEEVVDFLQNKQGNILDLGCGSGRNFTRVLGTTYAIDFSQKMLNLAKNKAKRMGLNVEFEQAEAKKLLFENNFFDSAISEVNVPHLSVDISYKRSSEPPLEEISFNYCDYEYAVFLGKGEHPFT